MDFTGKVVIVTGSSSGIGAATAIMFSKLGAYVTIVGTNSDRIADISTKCEAFKGNKPLSLQIDLTHDNSCETVVSKTIEKYGRLDVLVNSAGKMLLSSLLDDTIDTFDDIMNLNLRVPYKMMHLCVPHLAKTQGNIVNIVGAQFKRVRHGFLPYAIAKAGLHILTKSAAVELLPQGIRVNAVQPGLTRTNVMSNLAIDSEAAHFMLNFVIKDMMPCIKILEPEEVAKMVAFVASGLCPSLNGAALDIHASMALT